MIHGKHRARNRQSGVVLMIGMVLLLMLTLVAVGVIRLSTRHTQVVNNEQVRTEATSAANYALDLVLNEPVTTWSDLRSEAGRVQHVNLGTEKSVDSTEVSVAVQVHKMTCKRARIIKNTELMKQSAGVNYIPTGDTSCFGGDSSTGLTIVDTTAAGTSTGNSNCATVLYEMEAIAADPKLLNATAKVVQGVELRTDITTLATSCN